MQLLEDLRRARFLPRGRWLAKQVLVRVDLYTHRDDPAVAKWRNVLVGAHSGHVVVPSVAIESSRREAGDFYARGLLHAGDRVLDVGGGNGRQAIGMLELGVSAYVGLEIVRGSVEYANKVFADHPEVHFDFFDVHNDMYNPTGTMRPEDALFPYEDESFDFSVALSLYTHLERIGVAQRYVAETARVLCPSGTAFMSFFRSPPNLASESAVRTVFDEAEIRDVIGAHFEIVAEASGATTGFHDQWRLYLRKR